jgi:glycolate oxidase FAD binding subunit
VVVLRAATLPSEVGDVIEAVAEAARVQRARVRCLASAATGVVRAVLAEPAAAGTMVRALRPQLERRGGTLVVERAAGTVKSALDVWGDPGPGRDLMRRVKATFDPAGLFAPGRFVDGL